MRPKSFSSVGLVIVALVAVSACDVRAEPTSESSAPVCEGASAAPTDTISPAAFEQANAARARIEAGQLDGIEVELEAALAEAPESARDRVRVEIHVARSFERLAAQTTGDRSARARVKAGQLLSSAAETASNAGETRLASYALGYLGGLYEERGRYDEAATLTRRALVAADRARAGDALSLWYWQLGRIARARGDASAVDDYRRAVAQLDALRAELAGGSRVDALAFRDEVEPVYTQFVDLLLLEAANTDESARQPLLSEARATLEALKVAELRDFFSDPCLDAQRETTVEQVPRTTVLYPVILPDRVELIVGTDRGLTLHRAPVDGATLTAEAGRLRMLLTKRTTRQYLRPASNLFDWLIRPLGALDDGGTLVVVPSGALLNIPFATLYDAEAKQHLIEQTALAVTPGLTLTEPRAIDRRRSSGIAAGISAGVQGFAPLESVPTELEEVAEFFPMVVLLNEAFVAARFEEDIRSRVISIVHLASHGEFNGDDDASFVLAYDEKIPMSRLASIVASTRLRADEPLELLVLSACQTAAGDDRAALGLAGVALRSGARSAVASLWSVDDAATARLVKRFYQELSTGASRAEALRAAQRALLSEPRWRHPIDWAPFLLIGSWL